MTFSDTSSRRRAEPSTWVLRAAAAAPESVHESQSDGEHIYLSAFGGLAIEAEGSSVQRPLPIPASVPHIGVPMEYAILKARFGVLDRDWAVDVRTLSTNFHGRTVETFRVALADGTRADVHFDVTTFFRA